MLISYAKLERLRILSLHVGGPIAEITRTIVDPNTLKIIAFEVSGPTIGGDVGNILDVRSIREISRIGMIIDSTDELVNSEDVIKIRDVMKLNFDLIGMKVITKRKIKLGKVDDYSVNMENFQVQQLSVKRPAIRSILDPELLIGRSEIAEITDYEIIVKDDERAIRAKAAEDPDFIPNFVNPFREPGFAPVDNQNPGE